MQALTLPARRGLRWLTDGYALFRKNRLMLSLAVLGYWSLMALINAFPFVGQLATTLLIPVFSVSLMNVCRLLEEGRPFVPQLLFSGFQRNPRALLMLGAIYIAASLAILGIVALIDDGALFRFVVLAQLPDETALTSDRLVFAGQLTLLLFAPLMMAYWYAPVLVAWHDLPVAKALFFSAVACLRNWRAFLVYALAIAVFGALLPGMLFGLVGLLFAGAYEALSLALIALVALVLLPTLYASFYISYRDVFVSVDENV
jgi:hypothetical protein